MNTKKHIINLSQLVIVIFLLAGSLSCIAWFNPKLAEGKILAGKVKSAVFHHPVTTLNTADVIEILLPAKKLRNDRSSIIGDSGIYTLQDTSKHNSKAKTINADKEAQDTSERQSAFSHDRVSDENFHGNKAEKDSIKKFYLSPEWKAQMQIIRKQGEEIKKQFNSPEWKQQMLAMRKQGIAMQKQFNSPEWKSQMDAMRKQGEEMRKHFSSQEWKDQMLTVQEQSKEIRKQFDNPEWKSQMEAIRKQGEEMKKQFDSPEWKSQMLAMRKQGEEIKKQFDSPEWKSQMEAIRKQGEEMRKKFNSQEWKTQMENIRKQGEEIRKEKWILSDSSGNRRIYKPEKFEKNEAKDHTGKKKLQNN